MLMKKTDLLQGGEEPKKEPVVGLSIERFSEPREIKKTKRTTLEIFENTPLANWFRENRIVGVL